MDGASPKEEKVGVLEFLKIANRTRVSNEMEFAQIHSHLLPNLFILIKFHLIINLKRTFKQHRSNSPSWLKWGTLSGSGDIFPYSERVLLIESCYTCVCFIRIHK